MNAKVVSTDVAVEAAELSTILGDYVFVNEDDSITLGQPENENFKAIYVAGERTI